LVLFPGRPETPSVMLFTEILTFTGCQLPTIFILEPLEVC
jgi:hypothetical protein